jgi:hypothetical protein
MTDQTEYNEEEQAKLQEEDEANFDKAFEEFVEGNEQTEPEPEPELDQGQDTEPEPEPEPELDIDLLKQQKEELEHYKKSNEGRVAALQRKIDEMMQSQPAIEESSEPESDDSVNLWDELKDEDEILAQQIEARIRAEREAILREVEQRLQPIQASEQERYIGQQQRILSERMPDWADIVVTDEFADWVASQPPKVQELAQSIEASDYEFLLNTYKAQNGLASSNSQQSSASELQQKRKQKLAAAQELKTRNSGASTSPPDDFDKAFDFYANQG